VAEVTDGSEHSQQFTIKWGPLPLVRLLGFEACGEIAEWLLAFGTQLFEYCAKGSFGSIGGHRQLRARARVVQHRCSGQCVFDGVEGEIASLGPLQGLGFALECLEEVEKVISRSGNEPTIVVDHLEEPLKLLDGGGWHRLLDCCDALLEGLHTMLVHSVAEEIQTFLAEDAFSPVDDKAVVVKDPKDASKVFQMLFVRARGHQDVVDVNENMRNIRKYFIHQSLEILSCVF